MVQEAQNGEEVIFVEVSGTSYVVPAGVLVPNTTYIWNAQSIGYRGQTSGWANALVFETPATPPVGNSGVYPTPDMPNGSQPNANFVYSGVSAGFTAGVLWEIAVPNDNRQQGASTVEIASMNFYAHLANGTDRIA